MHLTIIQYRSNSEDYCKGCLMDSSDSDFEINHTTDPTEAAQIWANRMFQDFTSEREYAGWEIIILQDGFDEDLDEYDYDLKLQIMDEAKEHLKILIAQRELDAKKKRAKEQSHENEKLRKKELNQLAELLEKYPNEE